MSMLPRTAKSVRNAAGLLSAVLHLHCEDKAYRLSLPQSKKKRIIIPTDDQVMLLMKKVKGTDMKTSILLASSLGLRRSEISALKYSDINFKTGNIHIQRAMVRDDDNLWHIKQPKSAAGDRIIKAPSAVLTFLKNLQAKTEDEYIVPTHPDVIGNTFWRLRRRVGLQCRFHDLRHYYASVLLALGVPDKYAMRRTGHSTTNMLKNVYQHIMEQKDDELDSVINAKMNELYK